MHLIEDLRGEHRCAVACPPDGPLARRLAEAGIEHLPIPGTQLSFRLHPRHTAAGVVGIARSIAALRGHVRRFEPDVIHANSPRAGLLCARVRRNQPPALVVQVHDIMPRGRAGVVVRRIVAHGAERVVTVSHAATAAFNDGVPGAPATTLYIGFDRGRFQPDGHDRDGTRRALGVPDGAPLLVQVAQISPWKGQLLAVDAMARLRRTHPDAHLLLVGEISFTGPAVRFDNAAYAERIRRRITECGLEDRVHLLGRRSDVGAIMAAADLVLLPSRDEPIGTVVIESLAVGTPAVVTDEGGPKEVVADGVTGRVLPPRDPDSWASAVAELLDDQPRLREMRTRASASVAHLTDEAYAGRVLDVYAEARAVLA